MRCHLLLGLALLGGALGSILPDTTPLPGHNVFIVKDVAVPACQLSTLTATPPPPPPRTPCDKDCECVEGNQPARGRIYCGWCEGVGPTKGKNMASSDIIKCGPGSSKNCCNYGHFDNRCEIKKGICPNYKVFCPGGL
ncbi:hypothetical protein EJ04DRAFT_567007 [Polyplosphaeria fusca]|uniref:Uncharacterized protein n=1 Tax=Polyplosphaeria fusca TaxID=682080 RepID=A0A9P4UZM8_9PLEO|nr:hypothetical protein EJ04DRAFT_567007 [Polyplosphaeria fusca]